MSRLPSLLLPLGYLLFCLFPSLRATDSPPVLPLFQPAEINDPHHAVTCQEDPTAKISELYGLDESSHPTVLSICAKSSYGGDRFRNAGGYCPFNRANHPYRQSFDSIAKSTFYNIQFDPQSAHSRLKSTRTRLFCQSWCWCSRVPNTLSSYIPLDEQDFAMSETLREAGLKIRTEAIDLLLSGTEQTAIDLPMITGGQYISPRVIRAFPERSREQAQDPIDPQISSVTIAIPYAGAPPKCVGAGVGSLLVPTPQSVRAPHWLTEQEICAAEQHGGYRWGNVGIFCIGEQIYHASELAHPQFTSRTELGPFWRKRCKQSCTCGSPETQPRLSPLSQAQGIDPFTPRIESCGQPCHSHSDCGETKSDGSGYFADTGSMESGGSGTKQSSCRCAVKPIPASRQRLPGVSASIFQSAVCISAQLLSRPGTVSVRGRQSLYGTNLASQLGGRSLIEKRNHQIFLQIWNNR